MKNQCGLDWFVEELKEKNIEEGNSSNFDDEWLNGIFLLMSEQAPYEKVIQEFTVAKIILAMLEKNKDKKLNNGKTIAEHYSFQMSALQEMYREKFVFDLPVIGLGAHAFAEINEASLSKIDVQSEEVSK